MGDYQESAGVFGLQTTEIRLDKLSRQLCRKDFRQISGSTGRLKNWAWIEAVAQAVGGPDKAGTNGGGQCCRMKGGMSGSPPLNHLLSSWPGPT